MDHPSGGSFVKGHVGGLRGPEVKQQNRQLTGYSDDSLVPGLLAAAWGQVYKSSLFKYESAFYLTAAAMSDLTLFCTEEPI
jgi:hypothetical protein